MGKAGDRAGRRAAGRGWLRNSKGLPASPLLGEPQRCPFHGVYFSFGSAKTSIPALPFSKPPPPPHTDSRKGIRIPWAPAVHRLLGGKSKI